jgi:hypothetical protein
MKTSCTLHVYLESQQAPNPRRKKMQLSAVWLELSIAFWILHSLEDLHALRADVLLRFISV